MNKDKLRKYLLVAQHQIESELVAMERDNYLLDENMVAVTIANLISKDEGETLE